MRLPTRLALLIGAAWLLGACAGDGDEPKAAADASVAVQDFAFAPKQITVAAGGTVTWTNGDDFDHSVVIDKLDLNGPTFGPQSSPATFAQQFEDAGTYPYICGVHNSMTGTVVVTT